MKKILMLAGAFVLFFASVVYAATLYSYPIADGEVDWSLFATSTLHWAALSDEKGYYGGTSGSSCGLLNNTYIYTTGFSTSTMHEELDLNTPSSFTQVSFVPCVRQNPIGRQKGKFIVDYYNGVQYITSSPVYTIPESWQTQAFVRLATSTMSFPVVTPMASSTVYMNIRSVGEGATTISGTRNVFQ